MNRDMLTDEQIIAALDETIAEKDEEVARLNEVLSTRSLEVDILRDQLLAARKEKENAESRYRYQKIATERVGRERDSLAAENKRLNEAARAALAAKPGG